MATSYKTIADLPMASAANDSDLVEVQQGGTSRRVTVGQIGETIGVIDTGSFGAVGDGVANDTAAFVALEQAQPGTFVDLQGKTFLVSAVPTAASYYNGGFKVGSAIYPAAYKKMMNPYDAPAVTVARYPCNNWQYGTWFDQTTQFLWRAEGNGPTHGTTIGDTIRIGYSQDRGNTWQSWRTVFNETEFTGNAAFGVMSSGKWGGIVAADTGGTASQWFCQSTDSGATWTNTDISASISQAALVPYGLLLAGPSGAAGDWMVGAYLGSDIWVIRTQDNGVTWTDQLVKTQAGLPSAALEASIVRTPAGWLMFVRVALDNAWAATSSDFVTWSAWVDTGVELENNPLHALYDGGRVYLTVNQRTAQGGSRLNGMMTYSCEAAAGFADPTLFGRTAAQLMFSLPTKAMGYVQSCRLATAASDQNAPWFHVLKTGEGRSTTTPTYSAVTVISQWPGALQGVDMSREVVQVIDNPIMSVWPPRVVSGAVTGAPWTGFIQEQGGPGRWRMLTSGTSASINVDKTVLTAAQTSYLPFKPLYALSYNNIGDPDTNVGIAQHWFGEDAQRVARLLYRGSDVVCRIWCIGVMPTGWRMVLYANNSLALGGQAIFPRVPSTSTTVPWMAEVRLEAEALEVDLSALTQLTLSLDNSSSSGVVDLKICGVFLYPVDCAANMEFAEPPDTVERVERYARSIQAGASGVYAGSGRITAATTAAVVVPMIPKMQRVPVTAMTNQANWDIAAGTVLNSTFTFTNSVDQVIFNATVAGATTGQAAALISSAADTIAFDSGY